MNDNTRSTNEGSKSTFNNSLKEFTFLSVKIPVWIMTCFASSVAVRKPLAQYSQMCDLMELWVIK